MLCSYFQSSTSEKGSHLLFFIAINNFQAPKTNTYYPSLVQKRNAKYKKPEMIKVAALWTHADWLFFNIEFWKEGSKVIASDRGREGELDGGVRDEGMQEWEVED